MSLSRAAASQPTPPASSSSSADGPQPKRPKSLSPDPPSSAKKASEEAFWAQTPGFEQIWHGKSSAKEGAKGSGAAKGWGSAPSTGGGLDLNLYGKMLEPYRVSLRSLSRNSEYQVSGSRLPPSLSSS